MADLHWVNRAYMAMWADPQRPNINTEKDSPYVWRYDFVSGVVEKKDPKNIANKPSNYYLLENTKGQSIYDFLENELGKAENNYLAVVRNKIIPKKEITEEDRIKVATFMSLAVFRKPDKIEKLTTFINEVLNDWVKPNFVEDMKGRKYTKEEIISLYKEYIKETGDNVSIEDFERKAKELDYSGFRLELTKNKKLSMAFGENITRWTNFILHHNWLFLEGDGFITGDLDSFALFPLTPQICLSLMTENPKTSSAQLSNKEMIEANKKILGMCNSFVISHREEILKKLNNIV